MANHVSRRSILTFGLAAAALPWLTPQAASSAAAAAPAVLSGSLSTALSVRPFKLAQVGLGAGVFSRKRQLILDFLRDYDERRYLNVFRANAGLKPIEGVVPLPSGGWEGLDGEANGNLRGHFTGHHMSALAQAYASTGENEFGTKLRNMVVSLHECREALTQEPAVQSVPGKFGTAVDIARGSYVHASLPSGTVDGLTSMTFAAWVRPTAKTAWARLFDFGNNTSTYAFLAPYDSRGLPRFAITRSNAGGEQVILGSSPLPVNEWSHIAVTLGGGAGRLYVNGQLAGQNLSMTLTPQALGTLRNVWLGRSQYPDPLFAGACHDVNIWSVALDEAKVKELALEPSWNSSAGSGNVVSLRCEETAGSTLNDSSGRARHAVLRRSWGVPSHPGFLAAYPETQFIELETRTTSDYTKVWAPYYTAHKILKGLLDAHTATGEQKALDLAVGLCDWMHHRLSVLTPQVRQRMWGIFSSGEFGGIVEAILETYGHTGKAEHLELAKFFDLNSLIDACAENRDVLTGLHANQHIPIFVGLMGLYRATGEERYLNSARNFWTMVVPTRMYGIGGTSQGEFWKAPRAIAGTLRDTDAETCCAYNMLKLSRELFFEKQDPLYMDYYERALFNQVLGSKQDQADSEMPLTTYFIGLQSGAVRDYTPKKGTTCCEGTGMESATKYQDSVYFAAKDDGALYVNLYMASSLDWTAKNVILSQETSFPHEQKSTLTVRGSASFDLRLRVPAWATAGFAVRVNGQKVDAVAIPGSYFSVSRTWNSGDKIEIDMPFTLRAERALDDPTVQTLMYGPVNLVARDSRTSFLPFGFYGSSRLDGDLAPAMSPIGDKPLHFNIAGVEFAPFLEGTTDAFHAYFRRHEPVVVFGGVDTGVTNPARADMMTLLDDVWVAAPFANKAEFLRRVNEVLAKWVADNLLSQTDSQQIAEGAKKAAFATPLAEVEDLQEMVDAALVSGAVNQEVHDALYSRLASAHKALVKKSTSKVIDYLNTFIKHTQQAVTDKALQNLLISGGDALIVRLRS
jgi:DUF1680 family protein